MALGTVRTAMLAVIFLLFFVIVSGEYKVEGRRSISEEEDFEFERQLRIVNKPAIKTIKTEHGDVYNCVDIYKQPAFDHPLLKDHKIQLPEGYWSRMKTMTSKPSKYGLMEGCPLGTVPIRKITKKDLIRAKSVSQKYAEFNGRKEKGKCCEFAGFRTIKTPGRLYHGSGANFNLYNPSVQPGEFSSALISIESGPPDEQKNYIQFGWTVNPILYGDTKTRLFALWTKDNMRTTGCFNTYCAGFVHINPNIPLDGVFTKISEVQGRQFNVRLGVYQDNKTNDFNFVIGEKEEVIGYWPGNIFSTLTTANDFIYWGGQVYSPDSEIHSPQMGSGIWHDGWYQETCYFRRIIELDATYKSEVPNNDYIQRFDTRCYYADDNSYKDDYWGYSFGFGGTGGSPHDCRR
ncbi:uncharacterized protein LOC122093143 [Macadamia integrifolia]|uniref:uncharacterized protein LOC122093143 n=1 Tax=Macadamia integrifolia TaxID=60698 RepID=UPI001C5286CA|nr:uncharacterized protein LOC122093143 [Macadamia integrifolia]